MEHTRVTQINDYLADSLVNELQRAIYEGGDTLAAIPARVVEIVEQDVWRERVIQATGEIVHFSRFEDFVTTPPLEGLGTDLRTLKNLCRDDPAALDALDRATAKPNHRPETNNNIMSSSEPAKQGTSNTYALRKLRKDRPDLHEQVIAGEKSPHAAMVEAGFRKRAITVPEDLDGAARRLVKHFDPDELYGAMISARLEAKP